MKSMGGLSLVSNCKNIIYFKANRRLVIFSRDVISTVKSASQAAKTKGKPRVSNKLCLWRGVTFDRGQYFDLVVVVSSCNINDQPVSINIILHELTFNWSSSIVIVILYVSFFINERKGV